MSGGSTRTKVGAAPALPVVMGPNVDEGVETLPVRGADGRKSDVLKFETIQNDDGSTGIHLRLAGNPETTRAALREITGCSDLLAATDILASAIEAGVIDGASEAECNAVLAGLREMRPQDSIEGALCSQMVCVKRLALEYLKRSNEGGASENGRIAFYRAERLLKLFAGQVDTLKRYRHGGEQRVTVEHVTVNSGGQAIVGSVKGGGGGG